MSYDASDEGVRLDWPRLMGRAFVYREGLEFCRISSTELRDLSAERLREIHLVFQHVSVFLPREVIAPHICHGWLA